jgi:outer membrane protein assembly factor BamB
MNRSEILRFPYVLFLSGLSFFMGCESVDTSYTLATEVTKYTSHSLDYKQIIGKDYAVINETVKAGMLLGSAARSDSNFFFGLNISEGRVLFNLSDPSNDYVSATFDLSQERVFSLSSLKPSELYISDIETKDVLLQSLNFEKLNQPGRIITNRDQIFLINDVYGVGVVNQKDSGNARFCHEGGTLTGNSQCSTISFPVDDSLNLLCGHIVENDRMQLYAITNQSTIEWQYEFQQDSPMELVSSLNFSNQFVLQHASKLVSLSKENGVELWQQNLDKPITEIFKIKDKVLVYCLSNPVFAQNGGGECVFYIDFKLFDANNGQELWSVHTNAIKAVSLGICNNNLLLSDNNVFTVFSLDDGRVIEKVYFSSDKQNNFNFETLTDIVTGEYYLRTYDGKIYW